MVVLVEIWIGLNIRIGWTLNAATADLTANILKAQQTRYDRNVYVYRKVITNPNSTNRRVTIPFNNANHIHHSLIAYLGITTDGTHNPLGQDYIRTDSEGRSPGLAE